MMQTAEVRDEMDLAVSSDRSDQSLDVSVLPRRPWSCGAIPDRRKPLRAGPVRPCSLYQSRAGRIARQPDMGREPWAGGMGSQVSS